MKIKCVLIDDEFSSVNILKKYLDNFQHFEIISVFSQCLEALDFLNNNQVDVIFMDIQMPIMSGFELIRLLKDDNKPKIVITTAFREFAVESYELDVLDYLVKPIALPRFVKTVNKITSLFQEKNDLKVENAKQEVHIFIKVDKKMIKININEILFVEGMKEYIKITTSDKTYVTHKSLTSLIEELPEEKFLRIHKSFIIALDKVKIVEGNRIQISSHTIPIGRNFIKEAKNKILS